MAWKCAGRGQDPSRIDRTPAGGLIEDCLACPHPGCNLPYNQQDTGPLLCVEFTISLSLLKEDSHLYYAVFYMCYSLLSTVTLN